MGKTLTGSVRISSSLTLTKTGINNVSDLPGSSAVTKSISYSTATGVSTGANELYQGIRLISAGGYDVLDFAAGSLVNVVNDSGITFARVKAVTIQLLSADDNATYGNTCSGVLIRPHSASPYKLFFNTTCSENNGGVNLTAGDFLAFGTGQAAGRATSAGFGDSLYIGNQDGSITASLLISVIGSDT